jgi:hypothetical protein
MKTTLFLLVMLLTLYAGAQQTATTDDGKKVLLHDNGKWEYAKEDADSASGQTNLKSYTKPATAKTLVKSEKNNFAVWYDNKKWKKSDDVNNEAAEFSFHLLKGDGYAMAITERIEIDIANLKEVALANARNAAPDITLEKEDYRMVNGRKVRCLQMSGTASGIKFTYFGYYYSDESGTIQLVCFTGKSLMKAYQKDFEELLNGLVTIETDKKE